MADIVPDLAATRVTGAITSGFAGETIAAFSQVELIASNYMRASAGDPRTGNLFLTLAHGQVGDRIPLLDLSAGGRVNFGAALLPNHAYCLSTNYGGTAPIGDLGPTDKIAQIGLSDAAGQAVDLALNLTDTPGVPIASDQGGWDAATNAPDILAGAPHTEGDYWTVTVEGNQDIGAGAELFRVGDIALWLNAAWSHIHKPEPTLRLPDLVDTFDITTPLVEGDGLRYESGIWQPKTQQFSEINYGGANTPITVDTDLPIGFSPVDWGNFVFIYVVKIDATIPNNGNVGVLLEATVDGTVIGSKETFMTRASSGLLNISGTLILNLTPADLAFPLLLRASNTGDGTLEYTSGTSSQQVGPL